MTDTLENEYHNRFNEWDDFVNLIKLELPQAQKYAVGCFWDAFVLASTFGGRLPLPAIRVCEPEGIRFSWSLKGRYMDVSIDEKGLGEWFCSVAGQEPAGTIEDPEIIPTSQILGLLREHFVGDKLIHG